MSLITLLTDFGPGKYVAAMKGVILSINPRARIVDVDHELPPQDVLQGAFVLSSVVEYFPEAIHVAVVDPGVGSERRALVIECESGVLVGPDNGLLLPAARRLGLRQAFEITERRYCLPRISDTFHGRDVFAPVAAHLSLGTSPASMGNPVKDPVQLDFGRYQVSSSSVRGRILFKDRFGNLTVNVPEEALPPWIVRAASLEVKLRRTHRMPFLKSYASQEPGKPLLTISSEGFLEIAVNQGDASLLLGAYPGDNVTIRSPGPRKDI
jgi:S-adenosylmethionine hydrolase